MTDQALWVQIRANLDAFAADNESVIYAGDQLAFGKYMRSLGTYAQQAAVYAADHGNFGLATAVATCVDAYLPCIPAEERLAFLKYLANHGDGMVTYSLAERLPAIFALPEMERQVAHIWRPSETFEWNAVEKVALADIALDLVKPNPKQDIQRKHNAYALASALFKSQIWVFNDAGTFNYATPTSGAVGTNFCTSLLNKLSGDQTIAIIDQILDSNHWPASRVVALHLNELLAKVGPAKFVEYAKILARYPPPQVPESEEAYANVSNHAMITISKMVMRGNLPIALMPKLSADFWSAIIQGEKQRANNFIKRAKNVVTRKLGYDL